MVREVLVNIKSYKKERQLLYVPKNYTYKFYPTCNTTYLLKTLDNTSC